MDEDLYDEFGNYIGPDINQDSSDEERRDGGRNEDDEGSDEEDRDMQRARGKQQRDADEGSSMRDEDEEKDEEYFKSGYQVVLHEDKRYYPEAEKIYGPGVEALVMDEDAQPLTQPIIEPPRDKSFYLFETEIPSTNYSLEYLSALSTKPQLIRNVCIAGNLHSGKTLLCDMLIQQTHTQKNWDLNKEYKWMDTRKDEVDRKMSIKGVPMTLVLPDSREKNYLFNFMDTPGHPNFSDEVTAAARISDGMLLVIDIMEGITFYSEKLIKEALRNKMDIVVVINKLDRLVLELRLPLNDAYHKIKHTLDEVNYIVQTFQFQLNSQSTKGRFQSTQKQISPINNNVLFASTIFGCIFSIQSFALRYTQMYQDQSTQYQRHGQQVKNEVIDPSKFIKFLWGDIYYNEETRKFQRKSEGLSRSFIHFILEPFYKLVSHVLSNERNELMPIMKKLGIFLKKKDYQLDIKPLLKLVLTKFFGNTSCLVDSMSESFVNALEGTKIKVNNYYRNSNDNSDILNEISKCDSKNNLVINIVKLYYNESNGHFHSLGRIISGTVKRGDEVKILGEGYTLEEEEDMVHKNISKLWIMQAGGRYKIDLDMMTAGNWVLIEGVDASIMKTATIVGADFEGVDIFKPLDFQTESVIKVALEPLNPSELPKMLEGLRKISKTYPLAKTKVEESGEHIIIGTGELYMDSIFHDLRKQYAEIEIKVSEPFTSFCETVIDTSSVKCFAETPNKKNQIQMIAEPLDKGLAENIEAGMFDLIPDMLVDKYQWDELTAQSVWAFGPHKKGTNMLIDYTLSSEVDKQRLGQVKDMIVQGFQWATKEGPLCEEPIKSSKFKILYGSFANEPIYRSGAQIIPTTRRVCYSSFLLASPRVMEPIYLAEVHCPQDCIEAIYNVLLRRRAHVVHEEPKPGSPLYVMKIEIPGIESFGFETDLRTHTVGQAMVLSQFSHWAVVPGDPLDKSIQLRPLEPSPVPSLAREFMVKSRRRKGLLEDVSIAKFFDSQAMIELAKNDPSLQAYF
eukprot:403375864